MTDHSPITNAYLSEQLMIIINVVFYVPILQQNVASRLSLSIQPAFTSSSKEVEPTLKTKMLSLDPQCSAFTTTTVCPRAG